MSLGEAGPGPGWAAHFLSGCAQGSSWEAPLTRLRAWGPGPAVLSPNLAQSCRDPAGDGPESLGPGSYQSRALPP